MVIYYSQGPGIETEPETRDVLNCVAKGDYALLDYFVLAILLFFAFGGSAFASSQLTPISRHEVSNGVGRIFPMYHGPSAVVFFSKNVLVIDSSKKHLAYKSAVTNMPIWHRMIGGSENENAIFIKEGAFASGEEPSVWTEAPWHYWMRFFSFIGFAIIGVIGFALLKRR